MNINLQKINNFSELKEKTLVALTNTDNAEYGKWSDGFTFNLRSS